MKEEKKTELLVWSVIYNYNNKPMEIFIRVYDYNRVIHYLEGLDIQEEDIIKIEKLNIREPKQYNEKDFKGL